MGLPEEVVDHVYDFTGVDIDKDDIVVIPNPLVRSVSWREPVAVRIIDEEPRLEEQAVEEETRLQAAVTMGAIGRVIGPGAIDEAVVTPVIDPVVIAIAAPAVVPAAEITPIPAVASAIAPAPVVTTPAAPIAPEIIAPVAAPAIPAIIDPISTAGIARDIADLVAEAATTAIAPFAPAVTAVLDPIAADITAAFDPVCPAITTIFHAIGPDIPAPFDPACFDLAATVDPVSGAITATPIKLIAAEIAATLYPVGPNFAAPVDLASLSFAAAVNAVGADFAAAVNLLRALGGSGTGRHFTAKSARGCRAAFRCLAWRSRTGLKGRAIDSRLTTATAALGADLLPLGTGFGARLNSGFTRILRRGGGGGKSEGKRSGQGRERSASSKKVHHCQYLQYRRPTTSGALRSRNYAPQTVAGMNRLVDVQKNCG